VGLAHFSAYLSCYNAMNATQIVDYATQHTGISIDINDAMPYVNKRANEIKDLIKQKVNKDYFSEIYTQDIIANVREYPLPVANEETR
jgi:hypothetical protein